jgi:MoaA/NifB/PqqE/SkfB family radical SAM enzyme
VSTFGWQHLSAADKRSITDGIREGRALGGPYHLEIHLADRCNIDCFFCSTASLRGTDEAPFDRVAEVLVEGKELGTRSIRLSGGGEPLFHKRIGDFLNTVQATGIPIENLTTNGVLLREKVAELLAKNCDEITVSLNTGDPESYATMMQTPARNFERVLDNVRSFARLRGRRTLINVQFLIWKENYHDIRRMYDLAREIGADRILFNGLSGLPAEKRMSPEETSAMLASYEELIREDEFRTISSIESYEQDIAGQLEEIGNRISVERNSAPLPVRAARFFTRRGYTLSEKVRHYLSVRETAKVTAEGAGLPDECMIGWYSLLIRATGAVAPCCILQQRVLGNAYRAPLREIWHGPAYQQFRVELVRIMREREQWAADGDRDQFVAPVCGAASLGCPIRSFYFQKDIPFRKAYASALRG